MVVGWCIAHLTEYMCTGYLTDLISVLPAVVLRLDLMSIDECCFGDLKRFWNGHRKKGEDEG